MKFCATCKVEKDSSSFYKDKRANDGLYSHCKPCHSLYTERYRKTPAGYLVSKETVKKYHLSEKGKAARKRYYSSEKGKLASQRHSKTEKRIAKVRQDILTGKSRARTAVWRALKKGVLRRLPCEVCGASENVHAHHQDYLRALEVQWLCVKHHNLLHQNESAS